MEPREAAVAALWLTYDPGSWPPFHLLALDNLIKWFSAQHSSHNYRFGVALESVYRGSLQQRRIITVSCVSEQSVYIPTAAMMFCLCAIIAPAVTNGDERVNRLQPTDADNYCSLVASVSTPTLTDPKVCTHTHTHTHTYTLCYVHTHCYIAILLCEELNGKWITSSCLR